MGALVVLILALGALASGPRAPLGLDLYRPTPPDNSLTPAKIVLGRRLFHDRRLSRDQKLSCAACHDPARAFASVGLVPVDGAAGLRNVPTIINRAYGESFFWDGRADSLEKQVVQPLLSPREMAMSSESVVAVVQDDGKYREQFWAAFGRDPQLDDVARALASYVRTIRSGDSPYDRFRTGDRSALSAPEQRGMRVFFGRAGCWSCHGGPNLTDERFHNTGVAFRGGPLFDPGRFLVTQKETDRGAFKTPTLREIARTAPYMHDGSLATLEDVVDYYDRGGNANPDLDSSVRPIRLSAEDKRALVVFLRALNGKVEEGR